MMEPQSYISMASVALAALMALFGGFRYVTAQVESLRREIANAEEKARLLSDKATETQDKQRIALATQTQASIAAITTDIRALQREAVRHEQMDALEARLNSSLSKIEVKVDRLGETAGKIVAIEQSLVMLTNRIEKIAERFEVGGSNRRAT